MANVIKKATNRFTKGLVMDFSPENTKNEVLTHALNATLLTFNGNEMSLLNDMGNGRVETAYLPEGYIPVGTCEYGGIIYIVSYNPLEDKSLIGCFPSPERNISSDELGIEDVKINNTDFQNVTTGEILHNSQCVLLKSEALNPGDKFIVCSDNSIYSNSLKDLYVKNDSDVFDLVPDPILALNIVSIEENGKIVYLNSDVKLYDVSAQVGDEQNTYKYHILGLNIESGDKFNQQAIDIDQYRNVLSSGYSVFKSKISGKLAILAELIMVDSYSVTHSLLPKLDEYGSVIPGNFDVIIHTEVEPRISNANYKTAPKLKYYHMEKSLGYLQVYDSENQKIVNKTMFEKDDQSGVVLNTFLETKLSNIYQEESEDKENSLNKTLKLVCDFNFPQPNTYHGSVDSFNLELGKDTEYSKILIKFTEGKYHRFNYLQINDSIDYYRTQLPASFYFYNSEGKDAYNELKTDVVEGLVYYVREEDYTYTVVDRDKLSDYIEERLYKRITKIYQATEELKQDNTVEKFKEVTVESWHEASESDLNSGEQLYIKLPTGNAYLTFNDPPQAGVLYYIKKSETGYESMGMEYDPEYRGTIYCYDTTESYTGASLEEITLYFDKLTYPDKTPFILYSRKTNYKYKLATKDQIQNYKKYNITLYFLDQFTLISDITKISNELAQQPLYILVSKDVYLTCNQFKNPNTTDNYIKDYDETPSNAYPLGLPLELYTLSNFIPEKVEDLEYFSYSNVRLGNIQLPSIVYNLGIDLPFKYDYTIVPCMSYGKLQHLAVSNTVDFSKLHAFNQSTFNIWKYRIDDGYLRLTVGAEVYDLYETNKVDALVFEFYDHRGFAGSLQITDKKSFNGVFTKIIPLNSLGALSTKQIVNNEYKELYKRNVNIIQKYADNKYEDVFTLNDKNVTYVDFLNGWLLPSESDNDCGTIYANILYGVKAYLRRSTETGFEFIKKQDFFVYTLPIYNDYYYTVDNFSQLSNPQMELALTYKLSDFSTKNSYTQDGVINNGYPLADQESINSYLSGSYDIGQNNHLNTVKYYKYSGTTLLYLEVGLKADYNNVNIAYDPAINDYFTCTILLASDVDINKTFNVVSDVSEMTNEDQILNYKHSNYEIDSSQNYLRFAEDSKITISKENFAKANFIRLLGSTPISINYNFIVGYAIDIENIRRTQIATTTICALLHKQVDGTYNYEDFGIYEVTKTNEQTLQDELKYYSSAMFYNSGSKSKTIFGVCKLISDSDDPIINDLLPTMADLCLVYATDEIDSIEIKSPGKLNTGEPLKRMVSNVGKLTFCQPHAHGMSENYGVNLYDLGVLDSYTQKNLIGLTPDIGDFVVSARWEADDYDDCYGIVPIDVLFKNPIYNMVLNTKNSILYNSEFLSTMSDMGLKKGDYKGHDYDDNNTTSWKTKYYDQEKEMMLVFAGFTGKQIETFNRKLVETMKSVYAYNPDYDLLDINVGDVCTLKHNPSFKSNILSIDSKFEWDEGKSLNDYLFFGFACISKYINDITLYSKSSSSDEISTCDENNNTISQLLFLPNYTYCGSKDAYCLISQLIYNTPVIDEVKLELEFNATNICVLKDSEGKNTLIQGNPNRKSLYGYAKQLGKLVELDVSNYTIDSSGTLSLKDDSLKEETSLSIEITPDDIPKLLENKFVEKEFINPWTNENLKIKLALRFSSEFQSNFIKCPNAINDNGEFFVTCRSVNWDKMSDYKYNGHLYITPVSLFVKNDGDDNIYTIHIDSISLCGESRLIDDGKLVSQYVYLDNLTYDLLKYFTGANNTTFTLSRPLLSNITINTKDYWVMYKAEKNNNILVLGFSKEDACIYQSEYKSMQEGTILTEGKIQIDTHHEEKHSNIPKALFRLKINSINVTISKLSKLEESSEVIIQTPKTRWYRSESTVRDEYINARFRGSSITINDLVYDPQVNGHRLFIRDGLCKYHPDPRCRIFYRSFKYDNSEWHKNNLHYNTLYVHFGPSFTSDNLD